MSASSPVPTVGILIPDYRQPEATLRCVRRLLEVEGPETVILWIENGADTTQAALLPMLEADGLPWDLVDARGSVLPAPGRVGVILVPENLGYAGGNNVGLRLLHRCGVPYAWVMNNDTRLENGSSADLLEAARRRPEVGAWGVTLRSPEHVQYSGATLRPRDFSMRLVHGPEALERDPLAYVSGCSLFFPVPLAAEIGFLPEDYFLYYEDPAFSMELRRKGHPLSVVPQVRVFHEESLSTGRRSPVMEYYSRRNRWAFIQRYFPESLGAQRRRTWYRFQSLLFRGAFRRAWIEWLALRDWKHGRMGPTRRKL